MQQYSKSISFLCIMSGLIKKRHSAAGDRSTVYTISMKGKNDDGLCVMKLSRKWYPRGDSNARLTLVCMGITQK